MKKILILAVLLAVPVLIIIGCSNDDGPSLPLNDNHIGIWEIDFSVVSTLRSRHNGPS